MLRRDRGYKYLLMGLCADAFGVAAGLWGAYWLRFESGWIPIIHDWRTEDYLRIFPVVMLIWLFSLRLTHCYRNHPVVLTFNIARRLLKGSLLAVALIVAFNYFLRTVEYSRVLYPIALFGVLCGLLTMRALLQWAIVALLRGGIARAKVLIVGVGPLARQLANRCHVHPEYGYQVIGFVSDSSDQVAETIDGVEVVGSMEDLSDLIPKLGAHEIFVTQANLPPESYLRLGWDSERQIAQVRIVPNMVEMMMGDVYYDELAGIPLFTLKETPLRGWNAFFKRVIDSVVAAVALCFCAPWFALIAWLIRRDSSGPVLYRQRRVGIDGSEFEILKFRTMQTDAEENGPVWGGRHDDRCTKIGAFLRKWDIDELPQLLNVLRGEMSLVGPRPERPEFVEQFKEVYPRYMGRLRVRAGLTGWAQVHGLRGDTSIKSRVQYDLYYIENWSYWLDLKILILTFFRRDRLPPLPPSKAPSESWSASKQRNASAR